MNGLIWPAAFAAANINFLESIWGYQGPMSATLSTLIAAFLKIGWVAIVFNEVRGVIMAVPVLYAMYQSGGSLMALWLGFCSLAGIALSVVVPLFAARKFERFAKSRLAPAKA
ncbi:MAG: hypothetical protein APF78_01470 [Sphingomonadales bacterium BRH_c3]|nr:MAG: hypothetical protein APF78_01470 [Sphingomonadales bacterium BRH_c3]